MTQEALKLAFEALDNLLYWDNGKPEYDEAREAITAIKEALREHAMREVQRLGQEIEQEPVADAYTFAEMRFVVCPNCGNKRCPKANDHRNACTNSNEVGQKGSSWEHVKPLAQPEQEPFFTEANGFPQEFVSKDRQKQAIISMTEQCAALVWERDELQKQVWLYEKNGVTCQTYRHKVEQSCSECKVQMNYTTPPQRTWVGLTDEEYTHITDTVFHTGQGLVAYYKAIEAKLKERNT